MQEVDPNSDAEPAIKTPPAPQAAVAPSYGANNQDDGFLKQTLMENQELLLGIRRSLRISMFFNVLRFFIILIPLIIALIYLPPLIENILSMLHSITSIGDNIQLPQGFDFSQFQGLFER